MAYQSWSVVFGEQPSAAKWNILGTNDSEFNSLVQRSGNNALLLDANGNEVLKGEQTASAVNEVAVVNAATGNGPTIKPTGGDTDIDLNLTGKGTGTVILPDGAVTDDKWRNGVAFRAYRNAAWTTGTGAQKIAFDTENFDLGTNFDSTTNNRFVAPYNGIYDFSSGVHVISVGAQDAYIALYVNGSLVARGNQINATGLGSTGFVVADKLQLSATDYVEVFTNLASASRTGGTGSTLTYFAGSLETRT